MPRCEHIVSIQKKSSSPLFQRMGTVSCAPVSPFPRMESATW